MYGASISNGKIWPYLFFPSSATVNCSSIALSFSPCVYVQRAHSFPVPPPPPRRRPLFPLFRWHRRKAWLRRAPPILSCLRRLALNWVTLQLRSNTHRRALTAPSQPPATIDHGTRPRRHAYISARRHLSVSAQCSRLPWTEQPLAAPFSLPIHRCLFLLYVLICTLHGRLLVKCLLR